MKIVAYLDLDLNDIGNPVKTNSIETVSFNMSNIIANVIMTSVEKVEYSLEDSLIGLNFIDNKEQFYRFSRGKYQDMYDLSYINSNYSQVNIQIRLDPSVKQYRRKLFNLFELTGILGGVFELFDVFLGFILGSVSSYMFKQELAGDIKKAQTQYDSLKLKIEQLEHKQKYNNNPVAATDDRNSNKNNNNLQRSTNLVEEQKVPNLNELQQILRSNRRHEDLQDIEDAKLTKSKKKGNLKTMLKNFEKNLD